MRKRLKDNLDSMEEPLFDDGGNHNSNPPKNLKSGDTVKVLNLNQKGTVITEPNSNGDLIVQVGIMKINVNISSLRNSSDENEGQKSSVSNLYKAKSRSIRSEVDLRGQTFEEARINLDKYLDDAYLAKLEQVTIIHGKGTGALRAGIQSFLKGHNHIKSFREGIHGEGGSGVTIIEIKN